MATTEEMIVRLTKGKNWNLTVLGVDHHACRVAPGKLREPAPEGTFRIECHTEWTNWWRVQFWGINLMEACQDAIKALEEWEERQRILKEGPAATTESTETVVLSKLEESTPVEVTDTSEGEVDVTPTEDPEEPPKKRLPRRKKNR